MFRSLPFVMGFYFALLCPNGCLGSVILLSLNLLDLCFWSCGPFIVSVHSIFEQLVPRVVGFCLCLGRNLQFWNFGKRGKQGEHFPCFPGLVITVLPEYLFFLFMLG